MGALALLMFNAPARLQDAVDTSAIAGEGVRPASPAVIVTGSAVSRT